MNVELTLDAGGHQTSSVLIDGTKFTHLTRSLHLTAGVDEPTRLELELFLRRGATVVADAEVSVGEETAALLVKLGWTPPTHGSPPAVLASVPPS